MPSHIHIDAATLARELAAAGHGNKGRVMARWSQRTGYSEAQIYRALAACGFGSGKEVRRKSTVFTEERLAAIWEKKAIGFTEGDHELSTGAALEILTEEGHEWARSASVSQANRALIQMGYRARKLFHRIEASRACEQFQIDFSRSKRFQVVRPTEDDSDLVIRVTTDTMFYKEGREKHRLWICMVVDEFSRLPVARYVPSTGESALMGMDFLSWYATRPEDGHMMRHAPECLQGDQGAFLKSAFTQNALKHCGIERRVVAPGAKESNGKVERAFRSLWSQFELPLMVRYAGEHGKDREFLLSELNQLLNDHLIAQQDYPHPFFGGTRGSIYQQSVLRHRPPVFSEDLRAAAFKVHNRRVHEKDGTVSVDGQLLQAPAKLLGRKVRVFQGLDGQFVCEMVDGFSSKIHKLKPLETVPVGEFTKPIHVPLADRVLKDVREDLAEKKRARKLLPSEPMETKPSPVSPAALHQPEAETLSLREAAVLFQKRLDASYIPRDERGQSLVAPEMIRLGLITEGMTHEQVMDLVHRIGNQYRRASGT